jgi:hypothetical protein
MRIVVHLLLALHSATSRVHHPGLLDLKRLLGDR